MCRTLSTEHTLLLYHTCKYNRLPAEEPSGLKHVEDIVNKNIVLEKVHFLGLYCIIILQCQVQKA